MKQWLYTMWAKNFKAKDERITQEVNRVYRISYYLFNIALIIDLYMKIFSVDTLSGWQAFRFVWLEAIILVTVNLITMIRLCQKGLMDDEISYAESDQFPFKHYFIEILLAGMLLGGLACFIHAMTNQQVTGMVYLILFLTILIMMFVFTMPLLYLSFRFAKHRRNKLYQSQDEDVK